MCVTDREASDLKIEAYDCIAIDEAAGNDYWNGNSSYTTMDYFVTPNTDKMQERIYLRMFIIWS